MAIYKNDLARLIAESPAMFDLLSDLVAWDRRYPKSTINPIKGERELDDLFKRANIIVNKAKGEL